MAIQLGKFGTLVSEGRNFATNTFESKETGINLLKQFGNVSFVSSAPKVEEAFANNPEEGHELGAIG